MRLAFWTLASMLLYIYFGYPVLLAVLGQVRRRHDPPRQNRLPAELPTVSLVICAHNEEKVIADKLANAQALDYPKDRLEIVVASDGSSDRTNEIVTGFAGVTLLPYPRLGKTAMICRTVPRCRGEVVVLSDANVFAEPDAIRRLVQRLNEPRVGVAFANLVLLERDGTPCRRAEGLYWRYETCLKELETAAYCCIMGTGTTWAFWKRLFVPVPDPIAADDLVLPLKIALQGYRIVLDNGTRVYESVPRDERGTFRRRAQIGSGDLQALIYLREVWNPFAGLIPFCFWSHKVLRWVSLPLLSLLALSNAFLLNRGIFYQFCFLFLLLTIIAALLGWFPPFRRRSPKALLLPFYFYSLNLAILAGFFRYQMGKHTALWERLESER